MEMGYLDRSIYSSLHYFTQVKKWFNSSFLGDILISSNFNCQSLSPTPSVAKGPKFEGLIKLLSVNLIKSLYFSASQTLICKDPLDLLKGQILIQ